MAATVGQSAGAAGVEKIVWGKTNDGQEVHLYTLRNNKGMTAKIMTLGALLTEVRTPDRNGKDGVVVLGFDNLDQYLKGHPFFGAIAGRVANRIKEGKFRLDGKEYTLAINNGPNHLHGGKKGFDKYVWKAEVVQGAKGYAVKFSHVSPDMDEGYPGTMNISVTYTLTEENELRLDFDATTDKATIINVTNHSYFNLAGEGSVLDHELVIAADFYTPTDSGLIPTGEISKVEGTAFDFRTPKTIGKDIAGTPSFTQGYDHNFVLRQGDGAGPWFAARAYEPKSGRVMDVYTTEPGVQLYTANHMNGSLKGFGGVSYPKYGGFCLETQHFPDAINKPHFPTVVLRPGQKFASTTVFKFYTR
ncbi:MAG TPA: aldose epimerase family protein [Methylomirabilota bacterium]|nr:aldose epimerase family protein [Methylomirabilota bacterium]